MRSFFIHKMTCRFGPWLFAMLILCWVPSSWSGELPEYMIKAGFLYNFTTYTEWPEKVGGTLNLCVLGQDPFGDNLDGLEGKMVGHRRFTVRRESNPEQLQDCHVVFIARSATHDLPKVLNALKGKPVLTVADTPNTTRLGVAFNMDVQQNRITFRVNLAAARGNGLNISSKLLRLAEEVIQ